MALTISIRVKDSGIWVDALGKWGLKQTPNRYYKKESKFSDDHFCKKKLTWRFDISWEWYFLCKMSMLDAVWFGVRKSSNITDNLKEVF